jgi:glycosyltransferase involved in cell wall biosynthesis
MRFIFVSTLTFENWDWTNPDVKGIGGSETSHIEMSRRLALRGHDVISYAPVPSEKHNVIGPGGVRWMHSGSLFGGRLQLTEPAVWVVYRDPAFCHKIPPGVGPVWHIAQDTEYMGGNRRGDWVPRNYTPRIDRVVALCQTHATYVKREHPLLADKVCISSNGIKRELIEQVLSEPPERNPKRLMFASSPDRGLLPLLSIFERAKELVPDLELHVYYGFNNMETWVRGIKKREGDPNATPTAAEFNLARLKDALDMPGVTVHGRTPQPELAVEWAKAGIWCHPSGFTETSGITVMDAQALGAIPITIPIWAIGENVQHGVFIGESTDPLAYANADACPLTRARFAWEVAKMAADPERQETIRKEMMPWALNRFDWENFVTQWEGWATTDIIVKDIEELPLVQHESETMAEVTA